MTDEDHIKAHAARIKRLNDGVDTTEMKPEELRKLAFERLQWALDAEDRDLHGSAKEWKLTANIALQLARHLEEKQ